LQSTRYDIKTFKDGCQINPKLSFVKVRKKRGVRKFRKPQNWHYFKFWLSLSGLFIFQKQTIFAVFKKPKRQLMTAC